MEGSEGTATGPSSGLHDRMKVYLVGKLLLLCELDRSRKVPAILNGGMRINYGGANPPRNGGCTKLLTGVIVLDWNKRAAPAKV